ncbi:MAG: hypothetical protein IS632_05940 [Thaumarchaeota archaeon]|nr:hypothetical protein [Nitrososphaerota archaeon]
MGYLKNHLATLVMGVFAAVLTGLWPYFNGFAPVLDFVFLMAVPISWFLVVILWLAQVSTNYMHPPGSSHDRHPTEPNPPMVHLAGEGTGQEGPPPDDSEELLAARAQLSRELEDLRQSVKMKDGEIDGLKRQIAALETQVQIESIRTELANLRSAASRD